MRKNKVFLGGTCNNSTWREELIPVIQIDFFNPVVEDWTPECQAEEYRQKEEECNIHLYVITKEMTGAFSIAEAIDSVRMDGIVTILHIVPDGFNLSQVKSLDAICDLVRMRGGIAYIDSELNRTARVLNHGFKTNEFN